MNSCFKCHQTTLQAGPYQVTSKPPAFIQNYVLPGSTPGTDPSRVETVFNVEVGKSYPVEIQGEIRKDVLNALAAYTAEILPADPGYPTFILDDPNGLLGVGRPTTGIDTKTATLIVPKLEVTWLTKPGDGNVDIDDNPNTGNGKRMFVGSKSPSDAAHRRNTLMVKVKTTPALSDKRVTVKVFDVDDATDPNIDTDSRPGLNGRIIDPSDAGNDNNTDSITTTPTGEFVTGNSLSATVLLNTFGEGEFEFRVSMQPGNNFRVAATVFPVNDQTAQLANLNRLQVTTPGANYFVPAVGDQIQGGFNGALSPMLTVWRKLHLEFDSMSAVVGNSLASTVLWISPPNVPKTGQTTVGLNLGVFTGHDRYANGKLEFASNGETYKVLASRVNDALLVPSTDVLIVDGIMPPTRKNNACLVYDDDGNFLTEVQLPPALPMLSSVTLLRDRLQPLFTNSYIQIIDANSAGWNTTPSLPFVAEQYATSSSWEASKNISDSQAFWSFLVALGYQTRWSPLDLDAADGDPDSEKPDYGVTVESGGVVSVIYVESIRDKWGNENDNAIINAPSASERERLRNKYWDQIAGCIAHEIAHAPGNQAYELDHLERGVLDAGNIDLTDYGAATFKRFRNARSWLLP